MKTFSDLTIHPCGGLEDAGWLSMRQKLWPHVTREQHLEDMRGFLAEPKRYLQLVACTASGQPVGFAEASIRTDYVNGTEASPVAFLEGIYVEAEYRRRGVASRLVEAVGAWAREKGLQELASDVLLENVDSQSAHLALGFEETVRVVYFRKELR